MHKVMFWIFAVVCLSGCDRLGSAETTSPLIPTESIPTAAPIVTLTADSATGANSQSETPIDIQYNLNIWIDAPILIEEGQPGADLFQQQITTYDASHPNINFDLQVKQIAGSGGTLDYLRAGRGVADAILPDVVLLPVELLPLAAADQLIFPLNDFLNSDGLYAAPAALSTIDGQLYGYPAIATGLHHFAYASAILDGGVPLQWDNIVNNDQLRIIFAADSTDSANLLLEQYLANDGTLSNSDGEFDLASGPLIKALARFSSGHNSETLLTISAVTSNALTALDGLQQGLANGALVNATDYLTTLSAPDAFRVGPIPGGDEPANSLVSGWAWVITTPDPAEQQLSAEFITFITAPENLGQWSAEAKQLPANPTAFDYWPQNSYTSFLRGQLVNAIPYPAALNDDTAFLLQQAVVTIIENGGDITRIADEIISEMTP